MGINRIFKLLIFSFFVQAIISCKHHSERENALNSDTLAIKVEAEKTEFKNEDEVKLINFIKEFYTAYLSDFNNDTNTCDFNKYLSKDFREYLNRLDYDGILHAQDYEKFDLNTLKVSVTPKNDIYKVGFINMGYETILYVKAKLIDKAYKITNIARDLNEADADIVLSELQPHEYDFDYLKYYIKPWEGGPANTAVIYRIEDFDADTAIFTKYTFNDEFEYLCIKKKTKQGLELYYKKALEYDTYSGDVTKPLITIYIKSNDFYAKSPLIEDKKEIKLKQE